MLIKPNMMKGMAQSNHPVSTALGRVDRELAAQAYSLPHHNRRFVKDLRKVSARFFLEKDRRGQETHIVERHPLHEVQHGFPQGKSQSLFLINSAKLGGHRLRHFLANHLQHGTDGVTYSQGSRHQVDGFGKQSAKPLKPGFPLEIEIHVRRKAQGNYPRRHTKLSSISRTTPATRRPAPPAANRRQEEPLPTCFPPA